MSGPCCSRPKRRARVEILKLGSRVTTLEQRVQIDPELPPGKYRVTLVVASARGSSEPAQIALVVREPSGGLTRPGPALTLNGPPNLGTTILNPDRAMRNVSASPPALQPELKTISTPFEQPAGRSAAAEAPAPPPARSEESRSSAAIPKPATASGTLKPNQATPASSASAKSSGAVTSAQTTKPTKAGTASTATAKPAKRTVGKGTKPTPPARTKPKPKR